MSFDSRETSQYQGAPVECYRFSQGGQLWLFTSADRQIVISPSTFEPRYLQRSEIRHTQEQASGSLEVRVGRTNPVASLFIAGVPATPVSLTIYRAHRAEPEVVAIWIGKVASVSFEGPLAVLNCSPISQAFKRRIPLIVFQSQCNWALYGAGCGVSRATFRRTINVTSVSGNDVVSSDFAGEVDGWFTNGWLEDSAGVKRFIVDHVGDTVTLLSPIPGLAGGATAFGQAGCDRSEATCETKFNNLVNHMGFPRIPQRNPHDGRYA